MHEAPELEEARKVQPWLLQDHSPADGLSSDSWAAALREGGGKEHVGFLEQQKQKALFSLQKVLGSFPSTTTTKTKF